MNPAIVTKRNSLFSQVYIGIILSVFVVYTGRIQNIAVKGGLLSIVWITVTLFSLRKIEVFESHIKSSISIIGYKAKLSLDEHTFLQVRGFARYFSGIQFIFKREGTTMKFDLSHDDAKKVITVCIENKVKVKFGNGSKHLI
jgi:hypothetical protein